MTDKQVLELRDAIINIGYVEIISSDEDSYTIFEILNARGLDLEDHELLKNYIMRYLQPVERRDDVKKIWEDMELALGSNFKSFFRHYAVQKYDYDSRSGTTVYKAIQNATHGRGVDQLLDDIARKANYYKRIVEPAEESTEEYEIFPFFKSKRFVIFRPLLLSLMHRRALDQITAEKYNDILHFLYNFFVCYKIIGQENSNILSNSANKYAFKLETDFSDKVLDECLNSIKNRLPTLELFTNSFKNVCWSHYWPLFNDSKYKERCQLVLIMLEQYASNRPVNIPVTIEHILPDAICVENSQIGNLLPLEESLNRRCIGKSFEEKLDIYLESTLSLPRFFAKRYKGKQFNPQRRTEFLAKLVYNNVLGVSEDLVEKEVT